MSDYGKSNNRIDPFSEYIGRRLADKPTAPDAKCWDEIEARLQKKRAIAPLWFGFAVAASIIVAVFILNDNVTKNESPVYNKVSVLKEDYVEKEISKDTTLSEEKENVATALDNIGEDIIAETKPKRETHVSPLVEPEESEDLENTAGLIESTEEIEEDNSPVQKQKDADVLQYRNSENRIVYNLYQKPRSVKDKKWLMYAGLGSAGGGLGYLLSALGSSFNVYENDYMSTIPPGDGIVSDPSSDGNGIGSEADEGNKDMENNPVEKTYIRPSTPISFGFTVQKKINKTIGIETGLLYTYLSSDFKISGADYSGATLNLHYLGIPVNLIVNLWDKKQWNIYASGGGMVDKGMQYVYKKKGIDGKERGSISGLQWSLNGGVGVSYNLYKNMNLYVEPRVSYYFDCNQPISKRTEDPFSFNLRAGFRYDF